MPDASPKPPCPECGAPPAAPFERNPTMRRARHTARLILLLAIITPLLAASNLWSAPSKKLRSLLSSTSESLRGIPLEAMRAIADGSRPASSLVENVQHLPFSPRLSIDTTKVFVFRQRQRLGDEYIRSFGTPIPWVTWTKQVRTDVPARKRAAIIRDSEVMLPVGDGWFSISFGRAALTAILCLAACCVLRPLDLRRWRVPVATLLCLILSLWPRSAERPIYLAGMIVIPSWAVGGLPDKQGFPYPRTDAEARAIAAEVVKYTDRVGTTSMDGDFDIVAEISGSRPIRTFHGIPFPILQHTTLTAATTFPPHRTAAHLSWHSFDLQLPNTATATTRHILSLDIPALAQLIVLLVITYHIIRLIHYHILKRRHHKRLNQNLCPLCAYPAPKPA